MSMSQGELWLVNLEPTIGDEIRKMRQGVVVNRDALGNLALRVVVPITGWQDRFSGCDWLIRLDAEHPKEPEWPAGGEHCGAAVGGAADEFFVEVQEAADRDVDNRKLPLPQVGQRSAHDTRCGVGRPAHNRSRPRATGRLEIESGDESPHSKG